MFNLAGRTALVTGAGQGIGLGIARALASAGALVACNDLVPERAQRAAAETGGVAVPGDITDASALGSIVDQLETDHAGVDILVNNAGIPADGFTLTRFVDTTRAEWERFVELNLFGVLTCVHAVLPHMIERRHGRIVTISSEAGRLGAGVGVSLYGAAKAGAVGFSKSLSYEVARHGVTVNCLSLGLIDNVTANLATPGEPQNPASSDGPSGSDGPNSSNGSNSDAAPDGGSDLGARMIPTKRLGRPDDVGAAVVYLASDEAAWVTGQLLPVNGGLAT